MVIFIHRVAMIIFTHNDLIIKGNNNFISGLTDNHIIGGFFKMVLVDLLQSFHVPHTEEPTLSNGI
jgi:hypothetical protein